VRSTPKTTADSRNGRVRSTILGLAAVMSSGWVFLLLCGCAPVRPTLDAECRIVGANVNPGDLDALYARYTIPLILTGDGSVLWCPCDGRAIAGQVEGRDLAGQVESRDLLGQQEQRALAGAEESRQLAGQTEDRALAGGTETRSLAGATEQRRLAGATEARRLLGETQVIRCSTAPGCRGFRVSGSLPIHMFDGREIRPLPDRCVE